MEHILRVKMTSTSYMEDDFLQCFLPNFRELMHVDDAVDELLYKEKNNYIEAQEKALKKMHIDHILGKEEFFNKLRDFQDEESSIGIENGEFLRPSSEAAKGLVPITSTMLEPRPFSLKSSFLSKLKDPIIIDPKLWY